MSSTEQENANTQPLRRDRLFNNPDALVEGWYPLLASRKLKRGKVKSFLILKQRVAVWRGQDGRLRAVDAFCPHMGADLGNGRVDGDELRCFFHRWKFNGEGKLCATANHRKPRNHIALRHYPVRDHLGHIWLYAGQNVNSPLILPPGLPAGSLHAIHVAEIELLAHHHVMMAGGIDLQHFATVHKAEVDFQTEYRNRGDHTYEWKISGQISTRGWRRWLSRIVFGKDFFYRVRIGAGSMIAISYVDRLHVVWGCVPSTSGLSRVKIFSVALRKNVLKRWHSHLLTLTLLAILKDDDVKALPGMRFHVANPMPEDGTICQLIHAINQMPESLWTEKHMVESKSSTLNIGL